MLKAYEVVIENDQIKWGKEHPKVKSARAIITFLDDEIATEQSDELLLKHQPKLEDLGGSEHRAEAIPRRRYDY